MFLSFLTLPPNLPQLGRPSIKSFLYNTVLSEYLFSKEEDLTAIVELQKNTIVFILCWMMSATKITTSLYNLEATIENVFEMFIIVVFLAHVIFLPVSQPARHLRILRLILCSFWVTKMDGNIFKSAFLANTKNKKNKRMNLKIVTIKQIYFPCRGLLSTINEEEKSSSKFNTNYFLYIFYIILLRMNS